MLILPDSITLKPSILSSTTSLSQTLTRDIRVTAYYQNKTFGLVSLDHRHTTFHQDPKNASIFRNVVFQGWKALVLDEPVLTNAAHLTVTT
ncbi:hypothetical protein PRUPE_1G413200 [Prunus persica]|uniref:Uncharacterized protein n=1 Tax=Prunus persica TaxID=3760 RepID=A0A251RAY4_PRUPE|nr:hypothetical protein PRUPE_1G413200 [Prunus persica]